jgi:hypothetical protein
MVELIYEKNIKTKEVKRPARWVVRQDGKPDTDRFFELPKGLPGAYRDTRVLAERYITETLKLKVPETRKDRYTWVSEEIKEAAQNVIQSVKDGSKKVGELFKTTGESIPEGALARVTPVSIRRIKS